MRCFLLKRKVNGVTVCRMRAHIEIHLQVTRDVSVGAGGRNRDTRKGLLPSMLLPWCRRPLTFTSTSLLPTHHFHICSKSHALKIDMLIKLYSRTLANVLIMMSLVIG